MAGDGLVDRRAVRRDSSVVGDGTHVTLKLMVELKNGLLGNRVFYVSAQDGVTTSGWHAVGSWTVP
jgi:hypothetical protein